jgi:hypothetical protein
MTANTMCPYPSEIGNVSMRYSASNARKVARASISTSTCASSLQPFYDLAENSSAHYNGFELEQHAELDWS